MATTTAAAPLTRLSEEEQMFRDAVRDFAEQEVRPRSAAMEKAAAIDPTLIPKFFELGLMGIETPEALGGAGGSLFMTVLAAEELSAVDASAAFRLRTKATQRGDAWVLDGRMRWITDGAGGRFYVVCANTDLAQGYKGI